jgi:hypothetical protein
MKYSDQIRILKRELRELEAARPHDIEAIIHKRQEIALLRGKHGMKGKPA